jgi:hypothetical protein
MSGCRGFSQVMGSGQRRGICPLCRRVCDLTYHHLIPKKLHRRVRFRKTYSKTELADGIYLCRLCHVGLHALYDELTLARHFSDLRAITADPAMRRHAAWVGKQKA